MPTPLLRVNENGLYCEVGDFYLDPWRPVERAIISHAHSDHARWGSKHYLAATPGQHVLRTRLGAEANLDFMEYGESVVHNGVKVSFHPAGHILGSSQIRVEHGGEVWVFSGDYKVESDPTCAPFEPLKCDTFITECTFGLPIYHWKPTHEVMAQVNQWWRKNQAAGKASVVFAYALGKAQRLMAGLDWSIGPIVLHGAVWKLTEDYRRSGVEMPQVFRVSELDKKYDYSQALIVAPQSAAGTPWMRRFGAVSFAYASGWMQLRGTRRRLAADRGFALSDHVDWPGLNWAIEATGATRVLATHGSSGTLARWLTERGYDAGVLHTQYVGEVEDAPENVAEDESQEAAVSS